MREHLGLKLIVESGSTRVVVVLFYEGSKKVDREESKPKNSGLATASLVLGLLAIVFGVIGIGAILGILAIVFGAVSLKDNKDKSLAGIITGAIGIVVVIATAYFVLNVLPNAANELQANRQDTQRKNDIGVLVSDVTFRMSEDRGRLPDVSYVDDMTYKLAVIDSATSGDRGAQPTATTAIYQPGTDCDGNSGIRKYSISIMLNNGSKYCQGS